MGDNGFPVSLGIIIAAAALGGMILVGLILLGILIHG
jgi:hypothetical protein